MCDKFTAEDDAAALARKGLTRREFAALGAAATIAACGGAKEASASALSEGMVAFPTPDGTADAFFVHPAKGKVPGVIFWPDIAGVRDAMKAMARRLAAAGYAVLVINPYYRSAPAPIFATLSEWRTSEGAAKLAPMIALINPAGIVRDSAACVAFLDGQKCVDTRRGIGTHGYCMGGPFAFRAAAARPARVKAAASFHGAGLVTAAPDSPHLTMAASQARYLVAIAQNDDARAPTDKDVLRDTARAGFHRAEIEVYPADHGWCALDAPSYDKDQAERAWGRLLALYSRL